VIRFCAGLREAGERALTGVERGRAAALRARLSRSAILRAAGAAAVLPAGVAGGVALAAAAGPTAALAAFVATAFGTAAAALAVRDALRDRVRLGRDLREEAAVRLFAAGTRSLAVLAHSGRVVARDGAETDLRERAAVGAAAAPPGDPPTYAVASDAAAQTLALGLVRRALSGEEREELRGHARRLARIPAALLVATALGGLGVGASLGAERPGDGSAVLWLAVVGLTWWRALGSRRLAARLREDEADGWVLRSTAGDLAGTELLPASRASWTSRGVPAPWRLAATRR
jgi:hypothetical protein